jgi:LuxR family transcriptional regulator, maltose regulon positive regulatory protein
VRGRLLEALGRRWHLRLVTLQAGPGFGKTASLVAAMAQVPSPGHDVWLSCETDDDDADHLVAGLAEALGLPPSSTITQLVDSVWSRAPERVCLVLDDGHAIPPGSSGAEVLARLVADLPLNGHLLIASRTSPPVPTARLAAAGQHLALTEHDLLFDDAELAAFATARGVSLELLAPTGGWPALLELTAATRSDVVHDYLWEEVLSGIGTERASLLALLSVVGGGDDEVLSALAGSPSTIDELVDGVPLIERSAGDRARPHDLWGPELDRFLDPAEVDGARRRAARVHLERGRQGVAVDLFAAAGAWSELLSVLRVATVGAVSSTSPLDLARWHRLLPLSSRSEPDALLAAAVATQARSLGESLVLFQAAAQGYKARGDGVGELTTVAHEALVRSWMGDLPAILSLYERVVELAAAGVPGGRALEGVGLAFLDHLAGDGGGVLEHTEGIADQLVGGWEADARWLRSVAHRQRGDLRRADDELDLVPPDEPDRIQMQIRLARLRIGWLRGEADRVRDELPSIIAFYEDDGERYLASEATLELAAKVAWLGDAPRARRLVTAADDLMPGVDRPLMRILRVIAMAAASVAEGDEEGAAELLRPVVLDTLGQPQGWYWRDRAALALVHVLLPESRPVWEREPGRAHLPGLALAEAVESARTGASVPDSFEWPEPGVVRTHLPARWCAELVAAGAAAGRPAPPELLSSLGEPAVVSLQEVADGPRAGQARAARRLLGSLPPTPPYHLRISLIGPLAIVRRGEPDVSPELRRIRVRELLTYLVVHHRVRREVVIEELWPDIGDDGRNLRVTLSYLQRALQPERARGTPPYFLRAEGPWLVLGGQPHLTVDSWELEALLEAAGAAAQEGDPAAELAAGEAALPLWRGEPFADFPYASWTEPKRTWLRVRFVRTAVRAGELLLAAHRILEARAAAGAALDADPTAEAAHHLVIRSHLADHDRDAARGAMATYKVARADLGLGPDPSIELLVAGAGDLVTPGPDPASVPDRQP